MPRLIVHPRTPLAWEIQLKPGENYLGRAFANDFKIEDPSVSGSHCRIIVQDGRILLKDLGSTNGTFLNRAPVQEAALMPGQTLHLGSVELLFDPEEIAAVPAASPASAPVIMLKLVPSLGSAQLLPVSDVPEFKTPSAAPAQQPPIPPPISALKLSPRPGTASLASPPPAPVPEPAEPASAPASTGAPITAGATAIHVGEQSCKFHPKAAAHWLCRPCQKYFCDVCISVKRVGPATQHLCRTCGGECVPVIAVAKSSKSKGREIKQYSDGVVLARAFGFALAGCIISTLFWIAMVWVTNGVDVSFIYSAIAGAACGYGVKLGAQDRPGVIFSGIATFFCVITMAVSKYAVYAMNFPLFGSFTKLATDIGGVVLGVGLAWWIGGSD